MLPALHIPSRPGGHEWGDPAWLRGPTKTVLVVLQLWAQAVEAETQPGCSGDQGNSWGTRSIFMAAEGTLNPGPSSILHLVELKNSGLPRSLPPASLNKGSSLPSVPLKWTRAMFLALWFLVPWSLRLLLLVLSFTFSCLLVLFLRGTVLFLDRMHSCIPHNAHRHIVGLSSYLFNKCLCRES